MAIGPVETERRSPIVTDQRDVVRDTEGFQSGIEIRAMLHEGVAFGARTIELVRVSHADEIQGNAAAVSPERGA